MIWLGGHCYSQKTREVKGKISVTIIKYLLISYYSGRHQSSPKQQRSLALLWGAYHNPPNKCPILLYKKQKNKSKTKTKFQAWIGAFPRKSMCVLQSLELEYQGCSEMQSKIPYAVYEGANFWICSSSVFGLVFLCYSKNVYSIIYTMNTT